MTSTERATAHGQPEWAPVLGVTVERLAADTGLSVRTVRRQIRSLEAAGYVVSIEVPGQPNVYMVKR